MALPGNNDVAAILREIEVLVRIVEGDSRRASTYGRVARTVETLQDSAAERALAGTLADLRGIGPSTQGVVAEFARTGTVALRDELWTRAPAGLAELLKVPGLGPSKIHLLHSELSVGSVDDLRSAAEAGKLAALKGFGGKTVARILEGVAFVESVRGRVLLSQAHAIARDAIERLSLRGAVCAGEMRRGESVVSEIVVVAPGRPEDLAAPGAERRKDSWILPAGGGPSVRVRFADEAGFARVLFEETGPAEHVAAVLARRGKEGSEAEIYESRGLHLVPPERRHACDGSAPVPRLVEREDLHGLVHAHTNWSDGNLSLEELASAARNSRFSYLGLTDHSRAAAYANGLSLERLKLQAEAVASLNARFKDFRILHGIEVDILPDGSLDYPDEVLAELDFVIASVHSSFGQDPETMTARVIRAVRHPHVDVLGHATGRLLLRREGYPVDVDAVLNAAAEAGCAVELNANPRRLDLDSSHHARAQELGVRVPIDPDVHAASGLDDLQWGVLAARHGGLTRDDVPNASDLPTFRKAIHR